MPELILGGAVGNVDPFSGAAVLSRGLVGDRDGVVIIPRALAAALSSFHSPRGNSPRTTQNRASVVRSFAYTLRGFANFIRDFSNALCGFANATRQTF